MTSPETLSYHGLEFPPVLFRKLCLLFMNRTCWILDSALRQVENLELLQTRPRAIGRLVSWSHHCAEKVYAGHWWQVKSEGRIQKSLSLEKKSDAKGLQWHPLSTRGRFCKDAFWPLLYFKRRSQPERLALGKKSIFIFFIHFNHWQFLLYFRFLLNSNFFFYNN